MKRYIIDELRDWRVSKRRKPLVLRGARQVGKTWILKEFGKEFEDGYIRIDFDKQPEYHQFFRTTKDVKRIIANLALAAGKKITVNTLIIFDEIQACPDALNTLKYFCEDASEYYVVAAGSLLGLSLAEGFPVGKVDFLDMGPMTFKEFLLASGDDNFVDYIDSLEGIDRIPDAFHLPLIEKLKMYYIVGGMPEPVKIWTEDGDINAVEKCQSDILSAYENDFGKHAPQTDVPKIRLIWKSLPSQLSKENKKFLYSAVKNGSRAREYEGALYWLINANLVQKVPKVTKPALPLSAYEDLSAFKIYMIDVGLLRKHSHLSYTAFLEENRLFTEFKGALTENFVLESLNHQFEVFPYYWVDQPHEVDFIVQKDNDIYPVEVKSGKNIAGASIKQYLKNYDKETKFAIRFSLRNLSFDGRILNIPLYLIDELNRIIEIAEKNFNEREQEISCSAESDQAED